MNLFRNHNLIKSQNFAKTASALERRKLLKLPIFPEVHIRLAYFYTPYVRKNAFISIVFTKNYYFC